MTDATSNTGKHSYDYSKERVRAVLCANSVLQLRGTDETCGRYSAAVRADRGRTYLSVRGLRKRTQASRYATFALRRLATRVCGSIPLPVGLPHCDALRAEPPMKRRAATGSAKHATAWSQAPGLRRASEHYTCAYKSQLSDPVCSAHGARQVRCLAVGQAATEV
jgi:hypothetical protein